MLRSAASAARTRATANASSIVRGESLPGERLAGRARLEELIARHARAPKPATQRSRHRPLARKREHEHEPLAVGLGVHHTIWFAVNRGARLEGELREYSDAANGCYRENGRSWLVHRLAVFVVVLTSEGRKPAQRPRRSATTSRSALFTASALPKYAQRSGSMRTRSPCSGYFAPPPHDRSRSPAGQDLKISLGFAPIAPCSTPSTS